VTLVIQKALEPGFIGSNEGFFILLLGMLGTISLARCAINFFKHRMLINAGFNVDSKLAPVFLSNSYSKIGARHFTDRLYLKTIADLQRIQQAISLLIGVVLSDGLLVLFMFAALYYYQPFLVVIQVVVFLMLLAVVDRYLPLLMVYNDSADLSGSDGNDFGNRHAGSADVKQEFQSFSENYQKISDAVTKKVRSLSGLYNKVSFSLEAVNAIGLLAVLTFLIFRLHANLISYEAFLITLLICYGMSMSMAKICNQLFTIAQGADKLRKNLSPEQCINRDLRKQPVSSIPL
jgi:ABC-type multidrug transport system fused ATPase/permease subunit